MGELKPAMKIAVEALTPFAEAARLAEVGGTPPAYHVDANAFFRADEAIVALQAEEARPRTEGRGGGEPADLAVRHDLALMAIANAVDVLANRGRFGSPDDVLGQLQSTLRALRSDAAAEPALSGWVVGNGDADRWRAWDQGNPVWVADRAKATRYARREDAEAVHAEDEDAWCVQPLYASPIREPEISKLTKEAIIDAIRENVSADIHFDLCRVEEAADAILNLAPEGSSRSCVESSLRCAPERVCADALGKLIRYFEGDQEHDEGAFDEGCPDCAALKEARDVLSGYEADGLGQELAEQLESWRKLIRRGLLEVRDHDALEGVLSAAAKELSGIQEGDLV